MPFTKLQFKPGINRDQTNYSGEGGWWESEKIRFQNGLPQKLGGWEKYSPFSFVGVCRQMWNWITTYSNNYLAVGTNEKVYIEDGGYYNDITPLRTTDPTLSTPDTDNCVETTNTSTTVTIALGTSHGAATGSYVTISGVTGDVGGIPNADINANHEITVVNSTAFTISVDTAATSTATGGGTAIDIDFEIEPGNAINTQGLGWGAGSWGRDSWGLGANDGGIFTYQRDWWFDNFDNDLAMNIRNGEGYWWARGTNSDPAPSLNTRAIRLVDYAVAEGYTGSSVPVQIMQLLISQQDRHLIAFGAVPFGSTDAADFDPLLIRWADQDTPGDWTPTSTNTAGDLRLSRGSRIVRALPTRQEILVWTDTHLYTMQFLGTLDVFGIQEYGDNISIISPRAVTTASNITYWMGKDKFYAYTGRIETLPCSLTNHVFDNFNFVQGDQVVCGTNEEWDEVWWFYPTADSDYNNAYVIYNYGQQIWYYGTLPRTAWLDSPLRQSPQAANTTGGTTAGYIYDHEAGLDDDGSPMVSYIRSNDFDMGDGDQFMLSRRIIPDISFATSTAAQPEATLEIRHRNFPGSALDDDSEDNARVVQTAVGQYTDQIFVRARARQMALKVISEDLGVNWRLGAPRLDMRPDGRR
jgi:hypothetical protein